MGADSYILADAIEFAEGECIFEAGSNHVNEGSTAYLERVAALRNTSLVTADLITGRDAVEFLQGWDLPQRIKFAYLDSWDWPYENMDQDYLQMCREVYAERGQELTKDASAKHHLDLVRCMDHLVARRAVVAIDDTWWDGDGWDGKGRDAVPWLLDNGWRLYAEHRDLWRGGSGVNKFYVALKVDDR